MARSLKAPPLLPSLSPERERPVVVRGWTRPDRAPELRRRARRLDAIAREHPQPDRVRRLARDCRIRAAELELGPQARDSVAELADMVEMMRGLALAA